MVEMAMFNVQRAITSKVGKPELRFMCTAGRVMVLYICVIVCVEVLRPSQPNRVMSSAVSYLTTHLLGRLSPPSS